MTREDFDTLLQDYYRLRGWDEHGVPTPERLRQLELEG
ncbi:MAG: aldehyde ferredoxin oxidoreductase C-terminal domain-containing protein [Chloroflexota bacterium]|nr:aldehyde ferredoxin oxidoreductase C-terminal domain-containing protein [Chloroflexota bacterium]